MGKPYRDRIYRRNRLIVLKRDNYICSYCGGVADEADHIIPLSKGGSNTVDNLIASCSRCNNSKSNKLNARMPWTNERWIR